MLLFVSDPLLGKWTSALLAVVDVFSKDMGISSAVGAHDLQVVKAPEVLNLHPFLFCLPFLLR
jgi:hypothetical protein